MKETIPSTNKLSETLFTNKLTQGNTFSTEIFTHTDVTESTESINIENTFSENVMAFRPLTWMRPYCLNIKIYLFSSSFNTLSIASLSLISASSKEISFSWVAAIVW